MDCLLRSDDSAIASCIPSTQSTKGADGPDQRKDNLFRDVSQATQEPIFDISKINCDTRANDFLITERSTSDITPNVSAQNLLAAPQERTAQPSTSVGSPSDNSGLPADSEQLPPNYHQTKIKEDAQVLMNLNSYHKCITSVVN